MNRCLKIEYKRFLEGWYKSNPSCNIHRTRNFNKIRNPIIKYRSASLSFSIAGIIEKYTNPEKLDGYTRNEAQ